jgi:hypothetical protein
MNPEPDNTRPLSPSDCSIEPLPEQEAAKPTSKIPLVTDHRSLGTPASHHKYLMHNYTPPITTELDHEDFDFDNESLREHELILDDLASDSEDFARSEDEGWYYSDED